MINGLSCEVLRKENTSWHEFHVSFRINYKLSLPFITGLTGAEESRNEELDFEEKNIERVKNKNNI